VSEGRDQQRPGETTEIPHPERGEIPSMATDEEVREALERAFSFRGDVTITRRDGTEVEGYVFDRRIDGPSLADCRVRMFLKDSDEKVAVRFADIARLQFTGRDCAAGKSFETWINKYREMKRQGLPASQ